MISHVIFRDSITKKTLEKRPEPRDCTFLESVYLVATCRVKYTHQATLMAPRQKVDNQRADGSQAEGR